MITPEPVDRSQPTTIQVHPEDRCAALLTRALETDGIVLLELPGGRQAIVMDSQSQRALQHAFSDGNLVRELNQGLADLAAGRSRLLTVGERPTRPLNEA